MWLLSELTWRIPAAVVAMFVSVVVLVVMVMVMTTMMMMVVVVVAMSVAVAMAVASAVRPPVARRVAVTGAVQTMARLVIGSRQAIDARLEPPPRRTAAVAAPMFVLSTATALAQQPARPRRLIGAVQVDLASRQLT